MKEHKKRKINGFDIALILFALLFMAAAWFFLRGGSDEAPADNFEGNVAYFYVEVISLTPEQIAQVNVGDWVQDGVRRAPIGHVYHIAYQPHEMRVDNFETGEIYFETTPGYYTMIVTIRTTVRVTDRDILAEGQFPIKGGATLHFIGPGFAFSDGIILGIQRGAMQ